MAAHPIFQGCTISIGAGGRVVTLPPPSAAEPEFYSHRSVLYANRSELFGYRGELFRQRGELFRVRSAHFRQDMVVTRIDALVDMIDTRVDYIDRMVDSIDALVDQLDQKSTPWEQIKAAADQLMANMVTTWGGWEPLGRESVVVSSAAVARPGGPVRRHEQLKPAAAAAVTYPAALADEADAPKERQTAISAASASREPARPSTCRAATRPRASRACKAIRSRRAARRAAAH